MQVNEPSAYFTNDSDKQILDIALQVRNCVANKLWESWDFSALLGVRSINQISENIGHIGQIDENKGQAQTYRAIERI